MGKSTIEISGLIGLYKETPESQSLGLYSGSLGMPCMLVALLNIPKDYQIYGSFFKVNPFQRMVLPDNSPYDLPIKCNS